MRGLAWLTRGSDYVRPFRLTFVVGCLGYASMLVTAFSDRAAWVGWLPTTLGAIETAVIFLPSLAAAAGVVACGQARRFGYREWVEASPRTRLGRLFGPGRWVMLGGLGAFAAGSITIGAMSIRAGLLEGGLTQPILLVALVTVVSYLVFWTLFGFLIGDRLPQVLALAIGLVAPYTVYLLEGFYAEGTPLSALMVGSQVIYDYDRPSTDSLLVRLVFWTAVAAWLAFALTPHRRPRNVAALIISFSLGAAILGGIRFVPIPGAHDPYCAQGFAKVCVDGSHRTSWPSYNQAIGEVWPTVPEPLRPTAVAMSEQTAPAAGESLIVPPVSGFWEPARIVDSTTFAGTFGDSLFMQACTPESIDGERMAITLNGWWRLQHQVPFQPSAEEMLSLAELVPPDQDDTALREDIESWNSLGAAGQREWFAAHAGEVRTCTAQMPDTA